MEHHVYFWLQSGWRGAAERQEFEAGLRELLTIDAVAGGIWGMPAATPVRPVIDRSWDYALSLRFESVAAHDEYQADPRHHRFVEAFKDRWAKVVVMDVEAGS